MREVPVPFTSVPSSRRVRSWVSATNLARPASETVVPLRSSPVQAGHLLHRFQTEIRDLCGLQIEFFKIPQTSQVRELRIADGR